MKGEKTIPVITIDGPSGTGKGTIGRRLAAHLGWNFLDSGSIYRALALAAKKQQINFQDVSSLVELAENLNLQFIDYAPHDPQQELSILLDNIEVSAAIRTEQCGQDASKLAVIGAIRAALLNKQRSFARPPGLVTDGRDMGTVVFPHARIKFYLHATPEERAKRRFLQLKNKAINASLAEVVEELAQRDKRDSSRVHAPLKMAKDAIFIDTTNLKITQVFDNILKLMDEHLLCR